MQKFLRACMGLALMVAATLPLTPAEAQRSAGRGIAQAVAVVQAPEAAVEMCHAATPRAAQECALAKCSKKASRGACYSVTVCSPSGWTGSMGVKLKDVHFTESICGAPSREAVIAALKVFCQGHMPNLEQCYLGMIWGPNGQPFKVDLTWLGKDLRGMATP